MEHTLYFCLCIPLKKLAHRLWKPRRVPLRVRSSVFGVWSSEFGVRSLEFGVSKTKGVAVESAINDRPPSNIGRAYVITKEAKRKIITTSER